MKVLNNNLNSNLRNNLRKLNNNDLLVNKLVKVSYDSLNNSFNKLGLTKLQVPCSLLN